jgi:2,4-dienoyl-CoA reductase-like NADH-dependent reductase (Old Yellow Enzyme family)
LIFSEGTQISPEGQGYESTPGIHSPEQIAGRKKMTDAMHARGGRSILQFCTSGAHRGFTQSFYHDVRVVNRASISVILFADKFGKIRVACSDRKEP